MPNPYRSFLSENVRTELVHPRSDEWARMTNEVDKKFQELVESNLLKVVSVREASPPQILQRDDIQLGGLPADSEKIIDRAASHFAWWKFQDSADPRFQQICHGLFHIFGDLLSCDANWDVALFYIQRRGLSEGFLTAPRDALTGDADPSFLSLSSSRTDRSGSNIWVHIPFNNSFLMTVSMACFACYLQLTGMSRGQCGQFRRDVSLIAVSQSRWDLF